MIYATMSDHAYTRLRLRLLAALGLIPACASEKLAIESHDAGFADAGGYDASATPRDASPAPVDASATARDAGWLDAGPLIPGCDNERVTRQCFGRTELAQLAEWGSGGNVPAGTTPTPLRSAEEAQALFLPNGCLPPENVFSGCCNPAQGAGTPDAGACCYQFCDDNCCGRPFLVDGHSRSAVGERRSDWRAALAIDHTPSPTARVLLAAAWRDDALMEHASIAAFARFTLELLAFGAPPELVAAAQAAGADELEHARLCFALASHYAGCDVGPGPLAMSGVRPAQSLRECVLCAVREGCIGETLAATRATVQLANARDSATRDVLMRIVEDETRHAELAYAFVAWAVRRDPALASCVLETLDQETARAVGSRADVEDVDALAAAGRLSARDERRVRHETLALVVRPCLTALVHEARIRRVAPSPDQPNRRARQ